MTRCPSITAVLPPALPARVRWAGLLLIGCLPAAAAAPAPPAYRLARAAASQLVIDAAVDEPAWQAARIERGFSLPWETAEPPATLFRGILDDRFFAFAFEATDPTPVATAAATDPAAIARGDRVELFFAPDPALDRYFCLEIDPAGHVLDYAARHHRQFDQAWSFPAGLEVAGRRTESGYVVEGRIPLAVLESLGLPRLGPDASWRVGLFRADFRPAADGRVEEHWIAWADPGLPAPDFHVPAAFGTLTADQAADPAAGGEGWVELFDGRTLEGWTQRNGTATYAVVDGAIVGTTADGSPNSFLCSDREYGDFELVFETKVDDALNAGVQIRSQTAGGPKGRVNGPQVEVEASRPAGSLSGYVYGEAAGGWMTPPADRKPHPHFRNGEWNHYRVLAVGPRIQTWINGQPVGDVAHPERYKTHPRGFIGLQVHGIPKGRGPFQVAYRGIKIRPIATEPAAAAGPAPAASPAAEDGFVSLYNGKDLAGWSTTGNWVPQADGSLLLDQRPGETGYSRFGDYLWTERTYKDFVLDLEYAYPRGGNSGVYFRVGDRNNPVATGIEVQILDSSAKPAGAAMTPHDHGGIVRTVGASKNMGKPPGEWNRMVITCRGPQVQVELNGERIIDTRVDEGPMRHCPPEGFIGLQDHGLPHRLRFRNIRIKELKPSLD